MKNKKQIASNKLFNFCVVLGLLLAWVSYSFFTDGEVAWGIGNGIAALLLIVLSAIFTPCCYIFDNEGISLCYLFLPVERYLWKDIYAIEVEDKWARSGGTRSLLMFFLYASVFSIYGENVGKCRFYMNGHIRKSFRTKYLLNKYWDGTITGYLLEDIKKWFNRRRTKKQIKAHLTDEIVPMEREARVEAREWLKSFVAQAKRCDLDIKTKYRYITPDFEELNVRPQQEYTYTLLAEIAHFGETNKDRIAVVSVDLLYVRLGKTSYRGVKNKNAKEKLEFTISDTLNEINKNGIESYCKTH